MLLIGAQSTAWASASPNDGLACSPSSQLLYASIVKLVLRMPSENRLGLLLGLLGLLVVLQPTGAAAPVYAAYSWGKR